VLLVVLQEVLVLILQTKPQLRVQGPLEQRQTLLQTASAGVQLHLFLQALVSTRAELGYYKGKHMVVDQRNQSSRRSVCCYHTALYLLECSTIV
jgi:hypothetical protein